VKRDIAWTFFLTGIACLVVGFIGIIAGKAQGAGAMAFGLAFMLIGGGLLRR
jgi:hypothetical protein